MKNLFTIVIKYRGGNKTFGRLLYIKYRYRILLSYIRFYKTSSDIICDVTRDFVRNIRQRERCGCATFQLLNVGLLFYLLACYLYFFLIFLRRRYVVRLTTNALCCPQRRDPPIEPVNAQLV